MPIETVEDLRAHLELAIKVELSTVPPYLYAKYSIEDQRCEAAMLLRSIVTEEMLHATLAANLLLAVGGRPRFDDPSYLPVYPSLLPHHRPPLQLDLAACTPETVREIFMGIEQPEVHDAPAEPDEYETLGQFYHALEEALVALDAGGDLFSDPQADRQLGDPSFYGAVAGDAEDSGGLVLVRDLESARAAIAVIVHQGEGLSDDKWADPAHQELTHYSKLVQIADGTSPVPGLRPVPTSPRTADYPLALQPVSDLFNLSYRYMYVLLDELMQPVPDKGRLVGEMYGIMSGVLSPLANYLVAQPLGDGRCAAPTFERVDTEAPLARATLHAAAAALHDTRPELAPIVEALA